MGLKRGMSAYLTLGQALPVARDPQRLAKLIGIPVEAWPGRCHEVSLALLKTGEFGPGRVARGWHVGIPGQHSWIVLGDDVYSDGTVIVDATDPAMHNLAKAAGGTPVLVTTRHSGYAPHGNGTLSPDQLPALRQMLAEMVPETEPDTVTLTPAVPLSAEARGFLATIGAPFTRKQWAWLASNMPMRGWPAKEIIEAMADSDMSILVPVDIMGMVTDRNPAGLYLAAKEVGE